MTIQRPRGGPEPVPSGPTSVNPLSVEAVEAATPADRDRYVDALRVASLLVVAMGHWMMGGVTQDGQVTNVLAQLRWLQPLTWVLQVMAVFFLVGGVAHAYTLSRRPVQGPGEYSTFIRRRVQRLVRPAAVFLGVWVGIGVLAHLVGWVGSPGGSGALVKTVLGITSQLLWFLGVYLGVVALAPWMYRAHRRFGVGVVVVLAALAVVGDLLRLHGGPLQMAGAVNFAAVWLAMHQLGFCWKDGLLRRGNALWLAGLSALALVALVGWGPYPVSMVGLPGEPVSNMAPPSLALLAQGFMLCGLAVWARPVGQWLLARPAVWRVVVLAGSVAMSVYLWHLSALFLLLGGTRWLHLQLPQVGSLAWWLTRPIWLALLVAIAIGLVAVFARFEAGSMAAPAVLPAQRWRDRLSAAGLVLLVAGVFMIAVTGVDVLSNHSTDLLGLPVTPGLAVLTLALGGLALWRAGRARPTTPAGFPVALHESPTE